MKSKNFRVSFVWNGKNMWDVISAWSSHEAIRICTQRYYGATSFFVYEET
jgi:hypothetical protein